MLKVVLPRNNCWLKTTGNVLMHGNVKLLPLKHASHLSAPSLSPLCCSYCVQHSDIVQLSRIPGILSSNHPTKMTQKPNTNSILCDNCSCNKFSHEWQIDFIYFTLMTYVIVTFVEKISKFLCVFGILGQTAYINRSKILPNLHGNFPYRNC